MDQKHLIIDAYGEYVEDYIRQGWDGYFLSFMFNQLRGNREGLLRQMEREVERVYATLLKRTFHKPNQPRNRDLLPRWIICPDLPVPKYSKVSLQDVTLNGGLHLQGVGLQFPKSRLKERLDTHFEEHQDLYVKAGGVLRSVSAKFIEHSPKYVVGYGFKTIPRRWSSFDDLLILPKTISEVKDRQRELQDRGEGM
jgi:hypothetical protein